MSDRATRSEDEYRRRAGAGDPDAMFNLGVLLERDGRTADAKAWPSSEDGHDRVGAELGSRPLEGATLRWRIALTVVLVIAFVWPIVGSARVFPNLTRNADEVAWLAQSEVLESGALTAPAPPQFARNFQPWFATIHHGRYVYRYPPLFPAILAASDIATGTPRVALGIVSAWAILAVYLLAAELLGRRRPAVVASVIVGVSPIYFLTAAMFLGYVFFLAVFCTAAWLLARGMRTGRAVNFLLAGGTFGLAVFHRPFDALLLGVPWAAWLVWRLRRGAPRAVTLVVLGALPVILAMLAYNWHLTGHALKPPFLLWDPTDDVGFGRHFASLPPQPVDFTVRKGIIGVGHFWEDLFAWTLVGLPAAGVAALVFVRRARSQLAPLAGTLITLTVGWVAFYASYYRPFRVQLGPVYFLPLVVPLAVLAAAGVAAIMPALRRREARFALYAVGLGVLAWTLTLGAGHAATWEQHKRIAIPGLPDAVIPTPNELSRATRPIGRTPALVFLPYPFVGFVPPLRNEPGLDGPRLYAVESGTTEDLAIASQHPGRRSYRVVLHPDDSLSLQPLS
jgi:4-amino-4-deoxy-L-arabinose transferase-like glycosyltransferase